MYTFKITYIFIIYNLNNFFSYVSISVHGTLVNLCFFSYIGVILHPYCVIPMTLRLYDDFTLSLLGVPPAGRRYAGFLKG